MLAFTSRVPTGPLTAYTERTITDLAELERELDRVRRAGWAEAYEEREPELNAIAAPVWSSAGELAGIVALQGPIPRFGRAAARRALPALLERAEEISRELAWPGEDSC
jgi:DNA-binding IclR family transcriptional regulator